MATTPVVGVSMSREIRGGSPRDFLRMEYVDALTRSGALAIPLLNVSLSTELLSQCDGLLLTGGGDFHPDLFHRPDEGTDWSTWSPERDQVELSLMAEAERLGLPIFGICRGIQSLAIGFGGTIVQDIARTLPDSPIKHSQRQPRRQVTHAVSIKPGTRLAGILGKTQLEVNSFHHQSVDQPPPGWSIAALAPDGVVEAIERPGDVFILGVQWHPENLAGQDELSARLFAQFVNAASQYRRSTRHHGGNSD